MSEMWVDVPKQEVPPPAQWPAMSLNQLSDVKSMLMDKLYLARGKPMYIRAIEASIQRLEILIHQKMNDPRGNA